MTHIKKLAIALLLFSSLSPMAQAVVRDPSYTTPAEATIVRVPQKPVQTNSEALGYLRWVPSDT